MGAAVSRTAIVVAAVGLVVVVVLVRVVVRVVAGVMLTAAGETGTVTTKAGARTVCR